MKLGVISDIHGNIEALNKVLKEFENEKVDKIICLGDLVCGAIHSEEVVQKIISLKDKIIIVRGNHEGYVVEGMPKFLHDHKRPSSQEDNDRTKWVKSRLSKSSVEFLRSLPKERHYEAEGKKIYISHYPLGEDGEFKKHIKNANAIENVEMFDGIDADIFLYGHTHLEVFNVNNDKTYINPGSLGCPWKNKNAPYGILSIEKNCVKYEQLYVPYDVENIVKEIKEIKFPGYETVLDVCFGIKIKIMKEAVEDHRASSDSEPRTVYGQIVSSADRNIDVDSSIKRAISYHQKHFPELNEEEIIEDARQHLIDKFGKNGYAVDKIYFGKNEYKKYLEDLAKIANDKEKFFKKSYELIKK